MKTTGNFYHIPLSATLRVHCLPCCLWTQLLQTLRWRQVVLRTNRQI